MRCRQRECAVRRRRRQCAVRSARARLRVSARCTRCLPKRRAQSGVQISANEYVRDAARVGRWQHSAESGGAPNHMLPLLPTPRT